MELTFVKPEIINLKKNEMFNEKWLQKKIEEDPSILGLGELQLRTSEKAQVGGGRLDILLSDPESNRRYEVEIQLGDTDPSHIIRTIEYWDNERKLYPQYEHCAVIIAENLTSRFLNVISLFNGFIPLIAIQVRALKIEDKISLFFTKVLDERKLGLEEDDIIQEPTDKAYWVKRASKESVDLVDHFKTEFQNYLEKHNLKYNKHYIGLAKENMANNFISFIPRKTNVIVAFRIEKNDDLDEEINNSNLDKLSYDNQWKQYRVRIGEKDLVDNKDILDYLVKMAYEQSKE